MCNIEYRVLTLCDRCNSEEIQKTNFNEIHGNWYVCGKCGYRCWGGRLKNKVKNEKRPAWPSARDLGVEYCQICRRTRDMLGYSQTLETHHLDGDPTNNDKSNLIVVCTHHHKWIHHEITYLNEHYARTTDESPF